MLLGLSLRIFGLLTSPPEAFFDEADTGYQAYSLLNSGRDYLGNFLPIHPESFADRRPGFYVYNLIPIVAIFGLNTFSIRILSCFYGVLTILLFYWIGKKLTFSNKEDSRELTGLSVALIAAILPWHIHYSRIGFDVTALLFFLSLSLGFYLAWSSTHRKKYLLLFILPALISLYIYSTAKIFIPILLSLLLILNRKSIINLPKKTLLMLLLIGSLFILPVSLDTIQGAGRERASILLIFSDINLQSKSLHLRYLSSFSSLNQLSKVYLAPIVVFFRQIGINYFSAFSPQFLIFDGDPNPRHSLPAAGTIGITIFLLFIIGSVKAISSGFFKRYPEILIFLLLSPLPAALTKDGSSHATRLFIMVIPIVLIAGLGLTLLISQTYKFKKIILLILLFSITWEVSRDQFIRNIIYPKSSQKDLYVGWRENVTKLASLEKSYNYVLVDTADGLPAQIYFAYYQKTDPLEFQENSRQPQMKLTDINISSNHFFRGNIYFSPVETDWLDKQTSTKILALVPAIKVIDKTFKNIDIIDTIRDHVGNPTFFLIANRAVLTKEDPSLQY